MDNTIYPSNMRPLADKYSPLHPTAQVPFVSYNPKEPELFLSESKTKSGKYLRVAAYIRVSTDNGSQEDSYEIQNTYFSQLLARNPLWISAGIYSDYGISGTSKEHRRGFNRLLRHCLEGRIDHIVTKSISRFARNTIDFLKVLDMLKEKHITISFEKEHLDTSVAQNDLMLTIFGAIAQEESRNIAENITAGVRRRYPKGETKNIAIYGYEYAKGSNSFQIMDSGYSFRKVKLIEKEAATVRRIFQEAIAGKSFIEIARGLNFDQIPAPKSAVQSKRKKLKQTPNGILNVELDEGWTSRHIKQILRLERYCGDVLLQKTYKPDYKSRNIIPNKGELQQYYIKDHHPPIVTRETFQTAQKILKINARQYGRPSASKTSYPFSGKLVCSHCGRFYHTRNRSRRPIWFCASTKQNTGKPVCHAEKVYEEEIIRICRKAAVERFLSQTTDSLFPESHCISIEKSFTNVQTNLIKEILKKMEQLQMADAMEYDRAFLQEQISKTVNASETHFPIKSRIQQLTNQLEQLEQYWSDLEDSYEWRKEAIVWLQTLSDNSQGTADFLDGLSGKYVKAFILSIEIESPLKYHIRWFDNTWTDMDISI